MGIKKIETSALKNKTKKKNQLDRVAMLVSGHPHCVKWRFDKWGYDIELYIDHDTP